AAVDQSLCSAGADDSWAGNRKYFALPSAAQSRRHRGRADRGGVLVCLVLPLSPVLFRDLYRKGFVRVVTANARGFARGPKPFCADNRKLSRNGLSGKLAGEINPSLSQLTASAPEEPLNAPRFQTLTPASESPARPAKSTHTSNLFPERTRSTPRARARPAWPASAERPRAQC